jgi:hypothetical protein
MCGIPPRSWYTLNRLLITEGFLLSHCSCRGSSSLSQSKRDSNLHKLLSEMHEEKNSVLKTLCTRLGRSRRSGQAGQANIRPRGDTVPNVAHFPAAASSVSQHLTHCTDTRRCSTTARSNRQWWWWCDQRHHSAASSAVPGAVKRWYWAPAAAAGDEATGHESEWKRVR